MISQMQQQLRQERASGPPPPPSSSRPKTTTGAQPTPDVAGLVNDIFEDPESKKESKAKKKRLKLEPETSLDAALAEVKRVYSDYGDAALMKSKNLKIFSSWFYIFATQTCLSQRAADDARYLS